jgi:hypothetical protein
VDFLLVDRASARYKVSDYSEVSNHFAWKIPATRAHSCLCKVLIGNCKLLTALLVHSSAVNLPCL